MNFYQLFFISLKVPELMRFMDVVASIAPDVLELKANLQTKCQKITGVVLPKALTPSLTLSLNKPLFADLQPQHPTRKMSLQKMSLQ